MNSFISLYHYPFLTLFTINVIINSNWIGIYIEASIIRFVFLLHYMSKIFARFTFITCLNDNNILKYLKENADWHSWCCHPCGRIECQYDRRSWGDSMLWTHLLSQVDCVWVANRCSEAPSFASFFGPSPAVPSELDRILFVSSGSNHHFQVPPFKMEWLYLKQYNKLSS